MNERISLKGNSKILKNIEKLGERYYKEELGRWDRGKLQTDWWEALKYFLNHSFMRGRRDELSCEYYCFTIKVLEDYFSINDKSLDAAYQELRIRKRYLDKEYILTFKKKRNINKGNSIKHKDFREEVAKKNPIIDILTTSRKVKVRRNCDAHEKDVFLGNDEDIMMVLDTLKFIASSDEKRNIYNYLREKIVNTGIKKAYNELISIRAIGDKIASFIIRDIGLMNPEIKITKESCVYVFPIDTWVKKVADKLGCKERDYSRIKKCLCDSIPDNINILKVAAGSWYLGTKSLEILLENFRKN